VGPVGDGELTCWWSAASGVGITRDGLATLFREYVQGTEDEMCKPRTRGGTGLGLSICSKQVRRRSTCRSHIKKASAFEGVQLLTPWLLWRTMFSPQQLDQPLTF
jgi:hypothetical protein